MDYPYVSEDSHKDLEMVFTRITGLVGSYVDKGPIEISDPIRDTLVFDLPGGGFDGVLAVRALFEIDKTNEYIDAYLSTREHRDKRIAIVASSETCWGVIGELLQPLIRILDPIGVGVDLVVGAADIYDLMPLLPPSVRVFSVGNRFSQLADFQAGGYLKTLVLEVEQVNQIEGDNVFFYATNDKIDYNAIKPDIDILCLSPRELHECNKQGRVGVVLPLSGGYGLDHNNTILSGGTGDIFFYINDVNQEDLNLIESFNAIINGRIALADTPSNRRFLRQQNLGEDFATLVDMGKIESAQGIDIKENLDEVLAMLKTTDTRLGFTVSDTAAVLECQNFILGNREAGISPATLLCHMPFMGITAFPHSNFMCCGTVDEDMPDDLRRGSLLELWNSDHMNNIRKMMMTGEAPECCKTCLKSSDQNMRHYAATISYSMDRNSELGISVDAETGVISSLPRQLTIGLSNRCNLACRTCQPGCSTRYISTIARAGIDRGNNSLFEITEQTLASVAEIAPGLRYITILGGEPMIDPRLPELLDILEPWASNIEVIFHFNGSVAKDEVLERLDKFKSVMAAFSIDGSTEVSEYIRIYSSSSRIYSNLEKVVKKYPRWNAHIHTTLSNLNSTNLVAFSEELAGLPYIDWVTSISGAVVGCPSEYRPENSRSYEADLAAVKHSIFNISQKLPAKLRRGMIIMAYNLYYGMLSSQPEAEWIEKSEHDNAALDRIVHGR